jgi:hypothetical protein
MEEKQKYIICTGEDVYELEDEVNRNMKEGYFPIGGIVVTADGKLIQALTVFPTVCPC